MENTTKHRFSGELTYRTAETRVGVRLFRANKPSSGGSLSNGIIVTPKVGTAITMSIHSEAAYFMKHFCIMYCGGMEKSATIEL